MNDIILNSKYAPGVPTYGTSGQDGKKGDNGRSLFFIPFDIDNNMSHIETLIEKNKIYGVDDIEYEYSIGDSFVQPDGEIYMYKGKNIENVGSFIFNSSTYFAKNDNNVVYNTTECKFIICDDTSYLNELKKENNQENNQENNKENINSLLNIFSTDNNFIKIKSSDSELTISYDDDTSGFKIESNKGIFFNNLYARIDSTNEPPKVDGYQSIINDFTPNDSSFNLVYDSSIVNSELTDKLPNRSKSNVYNKSTYKFDDYFYEFNYIDASDIHIKKIIPDNSTLIENIFDIQYNDVSINTFKPYFIITSKKYFTSKYFEVSFGIETTEEN